MPYLPDDGVPHDVSRKDLLMTSWQELYAFMCQRDRAFASKVEPVPRDVIASCEGAIEANLPPMYVEFLATMGANSGRYHPFGAHQNAEFQHLLKWLPLSDIPSADYFRVARQRDRQLDVISEPYLDLTRSADGATPLITIEEG